jgi:transcriptional repressor NrdR
MRCPSCKSDNDRVVDSRSSRDGAVIRRRRECLGCGRRYTTYEQIEEAQLRVVKKDGTRVPFDRNKILSGLLKACEKRPVSMALLEDATTAIERDLLEQFEREVPSLAIGEMVINRLRDLDKVAYVRFASVYKDFKDVEQFLEELRPMLEKFDEDENDAPKGRRAK